MAETEKTGAVGGKKRPWREIIVLGLLGLTLLTELVWMAVIRHGSHSAAGRIGEIDHTAAGGSIRATSIEPGDGAVTVDNAFLGKLAALHETEIDSVRVPLDFIGHMNGGVIDGAWMGQAAEMMEMICQNNDRVIVSVQAPEANAVTQLTYINLWRQIDAAWGHRPASEMLYELRVPADADAGEWIESAQMILPNIREKSAERKVLLTLTPDAWEKEQDAVLKMSREYGIYLGLIAETRVNAEYVENVQKMGISAGKIVLVEPEAAYGYVPGSARQLAEQAHTGYLLRGY